MGGRFLVTLKLRIEALHVGAHSIADINAPTDLNGPFRMTLPSSQQAVSSPPAATVSSHVSHMDPTWSRRTPTPLPCGASAQNARTLHVRPRWAVVTCRLTKDPRPVVLPSPTCEGQMGWTPFPSRAHGGNHISTMEGPKVRRIPTDTTAPSQISRVVHCCWSPEGYRSLSSSHLSTHHSSVKTAAPLRLKLQHLFG